MSEKILNLNVNFEKNSEIIEKAAEEIRNDEPTLIKFGHRITETAINNTNSSELPEAA